MEKTRIDIHPDAMSHVPAEHVAAVAVQFGDRNVAPASAHEKGWWMAADGETYAHWRGYWWVVAVAKKDRRDGRWKLAARGYGSGAAIPARRKT